ncbi:protein of unknown function [Hyphomicrobium sp. MC1]|nr:protein of unknown function [Hyphomicrobium sp. MC1]
MISPRFPQFQAPSKHLCGVRAPVDLRAPRPTLSSGLPNGAKAAQAERQKEEWHPLYNLAL